MSNIQLNNNSNLGIKCRVCKNTYSGYRGWFDGTVNKINPDGSLNVTYKMGGIYTENFDPKSVIVHE